MAYLGTAGAISDVKIAPAGLCTQYTVISGTQIVLVAASEPVIDPEGGIVQISEMAWAPVVLERGSSM